MADYEGTSRDRRPDVVSRDYLTAFCIGPDTKQNVDLGNAVRAWRVRVTGEQVFLARSNRSITDEPGVGSAWIDEELLHTLAAGNAVREVDLAFTQNGDPIVCFERSDSHIWLYWFDPVAGEFVVTDFGAGRNPRVILDEPFDSSVSDVQLFFVSDVDDCIAYRQQRDRYLVKYLTPFVDVELTFLEDAFRDWAARLHLLISVHNPVTGRYALESRSSKLFPVRQHFAEALDLTGTIAAADSHIAVIVLGIGAEELSAWGSIAAAASIPVLTNYGLTADLSFGGSVLGWSIVDVLIVHTIVPEQLDIKGSIVSASSLAIVIVSSIVEEMNVYGSIASASSVVA